eukprot:Ihof_evm2s288 gene=Ihof_evmTU2s288
MGTLEVNTIEALAMKAKVEALRKERKKIRKPTPAPFPGKCIFYNKQKHRYCKMDKWNGGEYCTQHVPLVPGAAAAALEGSPTRVPCPYDPKHFVRVNLLPRHLHLCNSRPITPPPYYNEDLNLKPLGHWTQEPRPIRYISDLTPSELEAFQEKKLNLLEANHCYLEYGAGNGKFTQGDNHQIDKEHLGIRFERLKIDIAHIDLSKVPLINDPTTGSIIAYGKHLCGGATDLSLASLIDYCSTIEAKQKKYTGNTCNEKENRNTDSMIEENQKKGAEGSPVKIETVAGMMFALCCHHRCSPETYCNPPFIEKLGIDRADFDMVCRLSAWATCRGVNPDDVSG